MRLLLKSFLVPLTLAVCHQDEGGVSDVPPLTAFHAYGDVVASSLVAEGAFEVGSEERSGTANQNLLVGCSSITSDEKRMFDELISYRRSQGAGNLAFSRALQTVGFYHAENSSRYKTVQPCTMHSWMASPPPGVRYTQCCYETASQLYCAKDKPKELLSSGCTPSDFTELSVGSHNIDDAIQAIKNSPDHNGALLNSKWNGMGVGIGVNVMHIVLGTAGDHCGTC